MFNELIVIDQIPMVRYGLLVPPIAQHSFFVMFLNCYTIFYLYLVEIYNDHSGIMVEHQCCGVMSRGSSRQRGYKSQLLLKKLSIGAISYRISSLCVHQSHGYCCWLITVKGNIKNKGLATVQALCEPKNRGWSNHPTFPLPEA